VTTVQLKENVRARDGFRCTECGMTREQHFARYGKDLEVHRLTPGSPYTEAECVTLCKHCHGPKSRSPRGTYPSGRRFVTIAGGHAGCLRRLARKSRRTLTAEAMIALEQYFEANGVHLPPPPGRPAEED
jgi:hypothetical protein